MAGRFVRASKYSMRKPSELCEELLTLTPRTRFWPVHEKAYETQDQCYDNIRVSNNAWDTNLVAVNPEYLAVNWEAGGGGAFAVIPLSEKGRLPDRIPLFRGHTAAVLDTNWNPFNDSLIASGSDDGKHEGDSDEIKDIPPVGKLSGHPRKVGHVLFNPAAENVLASASGDFTIKIWDVEAGSSKLNLKLGDIVQSLSWSADGALLCTTSRDKKLRIWDVRQEKAVVEVPGHSGAKNSRSVWMGEHDRIATTGFSRMSDRQLGLWDIKNPKEPVGGFERLDSISGVCIPFWDEGTQCLYLAGKGDGNIRYYEYSNDKFEYLSEYKSTEPQRGVAFLPKRGINLKENEVMRAYKTINDNYIEPVSFIVPRRAETFQDDIYPPAVGTKPAVGSSEWFDGKSGLPPKLDLESLYEGTGVKEVSSDYKPRPAPEPSKPQEPVKKEPEPSRPEPSPAAMRAPPPSMKEQGGSMMAMADKYAEKDDEKEEESDTSSFEEVSKPSERASEAKPSSSTVKPEEAIAPSSGLWNSESKGGMATMAGSTEKSVASPTAQTPTMATSQEPPLSPSGPSNDAIDREIDPYMNIDAGTMAPTEHGECYVLSDGGEVDLDLGNYERYLNITLTRDNNITTGKIYQHVIERERKGDYLGKTVQVVPHLTDAIQDWVERVARIPVDDTNEEPDVCIIELGGSVGDIESGPFTEAMRQLRSLRVGDENFIQIFVSYVPSVNGEQKTKPTQQAIRESRSGGLEPKLIACRSEEPLDDAATGKVALFSNVQKSHVIAVPQMSPYDVPHFLEKRGFTPQLVSLLGLQNHRISPSLKSRGERIWREWRTLTTTQERCHKSEKVSIALVGKYTTLHDSYHSVKSALEHAAMACARLLEIVWIDASHLEQATMNSSPETYHKAWHSLCTADGVLVPGGFGHRGTEGMVAAANWARTKPKPYLGICLGMQIAVIEYARNVCGLEGASSIELDAQSPHDVVIFMPEIDKVNMGGTMRLGLRPTIFQPGTEWSKLRSLYGGHNISSVDERHRHRYEVNPKYVERLTAAGLPFIGKDDKGERMEILELQDHPWFVGVQYHPEYVSRVLRPSAPYLGFFAACAGANILDSVLHHTKSPVESVEGLVNGVKGLEMSNGVINGRKPKSKLEGGLHAAFVSADEEWFSRIVIITSIVVAATAGAVSDKFDRYSSVGGIIGTSVSAAFLLLLALLNAYILFRIILRLHEIMRTPLSQQVSFLPPTDPGSPNTTLNSDFNAILPLIILPSTTISPPSTSSLQSEAHLETKLDPLGILFGLGFDTSSEIALLGISSIEASRGTSFWLILLFPILFTVGMCLIDTIDGALMLALYVLPSSIGGSTATQGGQGEGEGGSGGVQLTALARDPLPFLYYSGVLTGITIAAATTIGVIQVLTLALNVKYPDDDGAGGKFWDGVRTVGDNYDVVGGAICGAFAVVGGMSVFPVSAVFRCLTLISGTVLRSPLLTLEMRSSTPSIPFFVAIFSLASRLAFALAISPVSSIIPTNSNAPEPNPLNDPSTNHGGAANCKVLSYPTHCTVTADFFPGAGNSKFNNLFNVYDSNCQLDPNSHKSIDPSSADRSVFGTPMPFTFDVVSFEDPIEIGFGVSYGSKILGHKVLFDPRRIEKPLMDLSYDLKTVGGEVSWQNWACSDPKDATKVGKCYAVSFQCKY
ncbi:MAG: hypothetical protein Q9227_004341 [Pyrenula ochraceoflavens]